MNAAERVTRYRERSDAAIKACQDLLREGYETYRPLTPMDAKYRQGKMLAFAMVLHDEREKAFKVSLDGDPQGAQWLPKIWSGRPLQVSRHEETHRFLVIRLPGDLANKKELPTQPLRPQLTDKVQWSQRDQEHWHATCRRRVELHNLLSPKVRQRWNYRMTE